MHIISKVYKGNTSKQYWHPWKIKLVELVNKCMCNIKLFSMRKGAML